jgi:hypothetical protein
LALSAGGLALTATTGGLAIPILFGVGTAVGLTGSGLKMGFSRKFRHKESSVLESLEEVMTDYVEGIKRFESILKLHKETFEQHMEDSELKLNLDIFPIPKEFCDPDEIINGQQVVNVLEKLARTLIMTGQAVFPILAIILGENCNFLTIFITVFVTRGRQFGAQESV